MRLFFILLSILVAAGFCAPKPAPKPLPKVNVKQATQMTDAQIKEQKDALRKLESELAKSRQELSLLETEEKGVLNTISLLDQNLNQTRVYINELSKSEALLQKALVRLSVEIDSLDRKIDERKAVMKNRIKMLYVKGRGSEAKALLSLLSRNDNPERQAYWVHHVLYRDQDEVDYLQRLVLERNEKQQQEQTHLADLKVLQQKKSAEEKGIVTQMSGQEKMLKGLKQDQDMQRRALQEFERNQKTMLALIRMLEERRKKEIEAAQKAEAERLAREKAERERLAREKKEQQKKKKEEVKPKVVAKPKVEVETMGGPKCMPLDGEIISNYGLQEHPVLHIMTRNLGVEIRGKRGAKIKAAAGGTVAMVAEIDGRGPSVIIEHPGGTYSVYGHMKSIRVKEGNVVRNCEEIGEVGDIASLNGIKLYFQVSEGTQTVDPLQWLKSK